MSKLTPKTKSGLRARRHNRVRAKISGTAERPRLAFFKSNTTVYAQLIDDDAQVTLVGANSQETKKKTMTEQATMVGESIAKAAKEKKITQVVFDRGGFTYTGQVQALADAARKGGLIF